MSAQQRLEPEQFCVLGWNPHVAGDPERIDRIVAETVTWADAWALNEVRPAYPRLKVIAAKYRLRVHQEEPETFGAVVSEKGSSALLLNRTVEDITGRTKVLTRQWKVFTHNRWHFGRRLVVRLVKKGGRRYKIVLVHGPTNGPTGGNRWAFAEFLSVLLRIVVSTRPGTIVLIVGDWNAKREDLQAWSQHPALSALGLHFDGHNVDWMLSRGAKVDAVVGKSKRGSDHYPVWFTATVIPKKVDQVRQALAKRKGKR